MLRQRMNSPTVGTGMWCMMNPLLSWDVLAEGRGGSGVLWVLPEAVAYVRGDPYVFLSVGLSSMPKKCCMGR